MTFVLDASAVLALLQDEPGGQRVRSVVRQAVLNSVNLTEVVTKLIARGVPVNEVGEIRQGIELFVHAHDEELGRRAPCRRSRGAMACLLVIAPVLPSPDGLRRPRLRPTGPGAGWTSASRSR